MNDSYGKITKHEVYPIGKLTKTYVIFIKETVKTEINHDIYNESFYTKEEACDELKEMIKRFLSVHDSVDILEQREDYFEASYKGGYIRLSVSD